MSADEEPAMIGMTVREALANRRRQRHENRTPAGDLSWWSEWCRISDERLAFPERPFGASRSGGTLSGFALGDPQALPGLAEARAFVSGLVHIQTDKVRSIEYRPEVNCADLAGGQIFVDPGIIDSCPHRPDASPTERLDILSGLALHEAAHHQFSSVDLCAKARNRGDLFFRLFNLLDDELIEMQLAQCAPGHGDYLRATRQYMFGDVYGRLVTSDLSLLGVVVLFVRYPRALTSTAVTPWIHQLERIRATLIPFPRSEEDIYRATEEIHACIAGTEGPLPSPALKQFLSQLSDGHQAPAAGRPRAGGLPSRLARAREHNSARRRSGQHRRYAPVLLPSLADANVQATWDVTWERPADDRAGYERERRAVVPHLVQLRRAIARAGTRQEGTSRGRRSGQLDRQKLYSLAFKNPCVFQRPAENAHGLTIALLVDESGSMVGSKVEMARRVAILFKEALASQPEVELFIYGHSADDPVGTTNILSYWAPGQRERRCSLAAIQARGNNRDGVAIAAVARDVRRKARYAHIVLVVVSDGLPHADLYTGTAAFDHTHRIIQGLRPLHVVHVGIDTAANGRRICDDAVSFTSLPELVRQMRELLEKLLSRP